MFFSSFEWPLSRNSVLKFCAQACLVAEKFRWKTNLLKIWHVAPCTMPWADNEKAATTKALYPLDAAGQQVRLKAEVLWKKNAASSSGTTTAARRSGPWSRLTTLSTMTRSGGSPDWIVPIWGRVPRACSLQHSESRGHELGFGVLYFNTFFLVSGRVPEHRPGFAWVRNVSVAAASCVGSAHYGDGYHLNSRSLPDLYAHLAPYLEDRRLLFLFFFFFPGRMPPSSRPTRASATRRTAGRTSQLGIDA